MNDNPQTQQNGHSLPSDRGTRRSKESQPKKPQKIAKKNLNGVFTSVVDGFSSEITKASSDFSEISEANQEHQTAESFVFALNPAHSSSSETLPLSDLTPRSKITTVDDDEMADFRVNRLGVNKLGIPETSVAEADILSANLLKQVRAQALNSPDAAYGHKKLLDGLLKVLMNEYSALPEERGQLTELSLMKCRIVFLSFLLWSIVIAFIFFFNSERTYSYGGPLPT